MASSTSRNIKIESGIQMLARLLKKPGIENFYSTIFENGPKHGDFIELYSEGNTSYLLNELICEALIPQQLNGPEAGVIIFNTDGNLYFNLISDLLRTKVIEILKITNSTSKISNDVESLLSLTLKNLHVLDIFDINDFYISIQNLENLLMKYSNVSLVIFHTLTAFYWSEQDFKMTKMDLYLKKLLNIIQKVIKDHKVTVMYSRPEYFSSKESIDNFESGCKNNTDNINYRIQIVFNDNGTNIINVRTYNNQFQRKFNLINNKIVWL